MHAVDRSLEPPIAMKLANSVKFALRGSPRQPRAAGERRSRLAWPVQTRGAREPAVVCWRSAVAMLSLTRIGIADERLDGFCPSRSPAMASASGLTRGPSCGSGRFGHRPRCELDKACVKRVCRPAPAAHRRDRGRRPGRVLGSSPFAQSSGAAAGRLLKRRPATPGKEPPI